MTGNVISVVGRRDSDIANADAIECLETWLEMAKAGEITSVAIAGIGPSLSQHGHSAWVDARLVGSVAVLQAALVQHLVSED